MSNIGLHNAMRAAGIATVTTAVGDRAVLDAMASGGYALGGEQSGHIVLAAHATTGDGLLTALHVMAEMARTGRALADLVAGIEVLPQILVNVSGVDRDGLAEAAAVHAAVADAERALGTDGRVLLRPSGTEPLVRVMVEAPTLDDAAAHAERIADVVRRSLG
jgi:phosphoglucosamine mutase